MNLCRPWATCTKGRKLGDREQNDLLGYTGTCAMMVLVPSALAQHAVEREGDVLTAKREVTVVEHEDLEWIADEPY